MFASSNQTAVFLGEHRCFEQRGKFPVLGVGG